MNSQQPPNLTPQQILILLEYAKKTPDYVAALEKEIERLEGLIQYILVHGGRAM